MNISRIDIVFENCEVASVRAKDVLNLEVRGCSNSISMHHYDDNQFFEKYKTARRISLILRPSANVTYEGLFFEDQRLFERMMIHNSITHLDLYYDDGTHEYIAVNWEDGATEDENALQRVAMLEGYLIIIIGDGYEED